MCVYVCAFVSDLSVRTDCIFPAGDLEELLDIGDFSRHDCGGSCAVLFFDDRRMITWFRCER